MRRRLSALFENPVQRFVRAFFRFFRYTLPGVMHRGGAVYLEREYGLPRRALQAGLRTLHLARRQHSFGANGHRGMLRPFRLRRALRTSLTGSSTVLELGLEPRGPAGRLFLKAFPGKGVSVLRRLHEELIRNIAFPEWADAPEGAFSLFLRWLCRLDLLPVSELRLRTVLLLRLKSPSPGSAIPGSPEPARSTIPPFPPLPGQVTSARTAFPAPAAPTLLTGDLWLFSRRWAWLNRRISRIALTLRPVTLYLRQADLPLHGYFVVSDVAPAPRHPHRLFRHRGMWHAVIRRTGRYLLSPGAYGGFDEPFPFHPGRPAPWLFFLTDRGTRIEAFRLDGQFPANHLQRFHVLRSAPYERPAPPPEHFCHTELARPPAFPEADSALYVSRIDLRTVGRARFALYDVLFRRPPLDAPPRDPPRDRSP